jgi:hypothetical protein
MRAWNVVTRRADRRRELDRRALRDRLRRPAVVGPDRDQLADGDARIGAGVLGEVGRAVEDGLDQRFVGGV